MAYFSPKVREVSLWQANGVRPVVSPDGKYVVYDYKRDAASYAGGDDFYDIRLALINRPDRYVELTHGRSGLPQRNNGNAGFHPLWPTVPIIIFGSEAPAPHYLDSVLSLGDPGVGLFHNLWAINVSTGRVYQLTNYPIKMTAGDGIVLTGIVFPRFTSDGSKLLWTKRYAAGGGVSVGSDWGRWRLVWADFTLLELSRGRPLLGTESSVYDPDVATAGVGNYVVCTSGFFPGSHTLVFAGNHHGQHEYNMDIYALDVDAHLAAGGGAGGGVTNVGVTNLMPTWGVDTWEEGNAICPIIVAGGGVGGASGRKICYMSNITSPYALNYAADWPGQEVWRELWYMNSDGSGKAQLTKFNKYVPGTGGGGPGEAIDDRGVNGGAGAYDEFIRPYGRAHPAAMNFSPDGMSIFVLVATECTQPYPIDTDTLIRIYRIDLNELL